MERYRSATIENAGSGESRAATQIECGTQREGQRGLEGSACAFTTAGASVRLGADVPNFPEASWTTFPVLATVLAGFAVTIGAQPILRCDPAGKLPGRVLIVLAALLIVGE